MVVKQLTNFMTHFLLSRRNLEFNLNSVPPFTIFFVIIAGVMIGSNYIIEMRVDIDDGKYLCIFGIDLVGELHSGPITEKAYNF